MQLIAQSSIRRQNLTRIVDTLSGSGGITRQEIVRRTGLSLMSVSNLIDTLAPHGAVDVLTDKKTRGSVGRPAELISLAARQLVFAVIDLISLSFRFDLVALDGSQLGDTSMFPYDPANSYQENLEAFLKKHQQVLSDLGNRVLGIAIAVPGPYDAHRDRVVNKRIPELGDIPLKALVQDILGHSRIFVDEDVKFAVQDSMEYAPSGSGTLMFYLHLDEGVGGAVVHDGTILRGLNAMTGDIGQLDSGVRGTFESRTSMAAFSLLLGLDPEQVKTNRDLMAQRRTAKPELYQAALNRLADETARMLDALGWIIDPHVFVIDCTYLNDEDKAQFANLVTDKMKEIAWEDSLHRPKVRMTGGSLSQVSRGAARTLRNLWIRDLSNPQSQTE